MLDDTVSSVASASSAPPDPELDLRRAFCGGATIPVVDVEQLRNLRVVAQESFAKLGANFLAGARANSFDSMLEHAAQAVLAAEAANAAILAAGRMLALLRNAAAQAEGMREALGEAMADSGVLLMPVDDALQVAPQDGADRVEIIAPALVPEGYWRRPPPEPDKQSNARTMREGVLIPGAAMVRGPRTVRFSKRRRL
jgi:hypothetical protein